MSRFDIRYLDLPIIRSCNLSCVGCMTFSDHKNIKGLVNLESSLPWLEFWSKKLNPSTITLFGGEPLLHPGFVDWAKKIRNLWDNQSVIAVNTNGYYLDTIIDQIPELFKPVPVLQSIIVSIQTGHDPYLSKVQENIKIFKQKIVDYYLTMPKVKTARWHLWLDESETNNKQWFNLEINGEGSPIGMAVCEMYKLHWVAHYKGSGPNVEPVYRYAEKWYEGNHSFCQAKNYVTLYNGDLYKCPPVGVLEHTLNTFDLKNTDCWKPYIENYKKLAAFSGDEEIAAWIETQKNPELVCNMCGFSGPNAVDINRSHLLKPNWKFKILSS